MIYENKTFVFVQTFNKLGHTGLCSHKIILKPVLENLC